MANTLKERVHRLRHNLMKMPCEACNDEVRVTDVEPIYVTLVAERGSRFLCLRCTIMSHISSQTQSSLYFKDLEDKLEKESDSVH